MSQSANYDSFCETASTSRLLKCHGRDNKFADLYLCTPLTYSIVLTDRKSTPEAEANDESFYQRRF